MGRWIVLACGVILAANGFYTRTYDFPNETPVRYCFNMDYAGIDGCFQNPTAPMLIAWIPFLVGLGLITLSIVSSSRRRS